MTDTTISVRKKTTDLLQAVILWSTCVSIAVNRNLHGGSLTHDTVCHNAVYKVPTTETKYCIIIVFRTKHTDIKPTSKQNNQLLTVMIAWLANVSGADVAC